MDKISVTVYALIDNDYVRIMAEPEGEKPVCLFKYDRQLPDTCDELIAFQMDFKKE